MRMRKSLRRKRIVAIFWLSDSSSSTRASILLRRSQAGPEAFAALRRIIEDRRLDMDLREQALFWLVQAESDERFAYVETLITGR